MSVASTDKHRCPLQEISDPPIRSRSESSIVRLRRVTTVRVRHPAYAFMHSKLPTLPTSLTPAARCMCACPYRQPAYVVACLMPPASCPSVPSMPSAPRMLAPTPSTPLLIRSIPLPLSHARIC